MVKTVTQEFTLLAEARVQYRQQTLSLTGPNKRVLHDGEFVLYQSRYVRGPMIVGHDAAEWSNWSTSFAVHEDDLEGIASVAAEANTALNDMRADKKAALAKLGAK